MREITLVHYVEQICEGTHYKGYIKIADTRLDYDLQFSAHLPSDSDELQYGTSMAEFRQLFQLTMKRDKLNIELTDDEYNFFAGEIFIKSAIKLYSLSAKDRLMEGKAYFPPCIRKMLNKPKFGCISTD